MEYSDPVMKFQTPFILLLVQPMILQLNYFVKKFFSFGDKEKPAEAGLSV